MQDAHLGHDVRHADNVHQVDVAILNRDGGTEERGTEHRGEVVQGHLVVTGVCGNPDEGLKNKEVIWEIL